MPQLSLFIFLLLLSKTLLIQPLKYRFLKCCPLCNITICWIILAYSFFCRATEPVLWAEQCDDRAVLWEHLISSTRGAKQHHNMPWYLACALSGKVAGGLTLIAKMPPEYEHATSPAPDHETTRECSFPHVYPHTRSVGEHSCVQQCELRTTQY